MDQPAHDGGGGKEQAEGAGGGCEVGR
jgi:hypothetical protein